MQYFNVVIVHTDGRGTTISNRKAETKRDAFLYELNHARDRDIDEMLSITVVPKVREDY